MNRNHRENRPGRPRAKNRDPERQPPRSGVDLPLPAFLKLLRQSPPKSEQ
jgi:hypothetical protein